MQPNFTRKKTRRFFRLTPLILLFLFLAGKTQSQVITLTTEADPTYNGLNTFGAVNSAVTFVISNTNGFPVVLNGVDCYFDPGAIGGTSTVPTLWYSTTSLGGAPTIAGPTWTSLATGPAVNFPAAGYYNVLNGLSFSIPAGTQVRFALQGGSGLSYSGGGTGVPAINTFTNSGVSLQVGNVLAGGLNVGYAGAFPAPTFNPRYFTGRVRVDVSSAPCSGTPAPGNTVSSVGTVCSGISFNLSLQNPTPGSGVTYQWESATSAGGPWSPIAGATNATLTTSQTAATCYRASVTCAGNTTFSTPICVALTPATSCYCIPPATDCTDNDMITRVRISTLDNASTCGTGPPLGYTNYTVTVPAPVVYSGAGNPIIIDKPAVWSEGAAVWIDYNQNGNLEASEATNIPATPAGTAPLTANIVIPTSALPGPTRMRVRLQFAGVPAGPCAAYTFGETEDYTVNIQPCVPITITGSPANTSTVCGGNASFTVTTTGSLPQYAWEYRTSSAVPFWTLVPNSAPYSGVNTATLNITNASAALNGYQYRAVLVGGCSATDVSAPGTLTVTPIIPVVTPASATICRGTVQQLSLTNTVSAPITAVFNATGLPTIIPDNNLAGMEKQITVAGIPVGSLITNISVKLSITHTWVGDLVLNMTSPTNQTMNMFALLDGFSGGNGTDDFTNTEISALGVNNLSGAPAPRTGLFRPEAWTITGPANFITNTTSFAPYLTANPNGVWKFLFADAAGGDEGPLTALSLEITYTAPAFAQGTWTGPAGTMWTNAGATIAYTGTPATTIYVNPQTSANYQVSFTTPTPCTSATTTVPVTVIVPISAVVNPSNTAACVGSNATFTASATGGPLTFQWERSIDAGLTWTPIAGATSGTLTVTGVTSAMNGYRYRAVISANPCAPATTASATLTVNSLPTVAISSADLSLAPGQTTTITGTTSPAAAANGWSWTLDGSAIAGTTNSQTVNIDGLGTYRARVVDVNGCVAFSNNLTIGAEASDRLWIYPNPSNGVFQVRLYYGGPVTERRVVSIFKSNGQKVMEKEFTLDNVVSPYLRMDFDLGVLAAGTYVVKVHNTVTGKITSGLAVVQHD
jgi:subtilisin-like proprotein convertase family protein